MADEIHQMFLFVRQDMNPLEQFYIIYYMFANLMQEGEDMYDMLKRLSKHDYYDIGKDIADMLLEGLDG